MGPADPTAPALVPAHGLSRTESYLDGRAFGDHAEFFWRLGWGKILDYHRQGAGHLPVRNVIGLSPRGRLNVQLAAGHWWRLYVTGQAHGLIAGERNSSGSKPPPATRPGYLPPRIQVTGRTDFEHATFGIGGSSIERSRAALQAGYHSGFAKVSGPTGKPYLDQARPGPGPGPGPAPQPPPKLKPKPRPAAASASPPPPPVWKQPKEPVITVHPVPPPVTIGPKPAPAPKVAPRPAPRPASASASVAKVPELTPKMAAWQPRPGSDFRRFTDPADMDIWGFQRFSDWTTSLTRDEYDAIAYYTYAGYREINPRIWSGQFTPGMPPANRLDATINVLTEAIRRSRLPEPIEVTRDVKSLTAMGHGLDTLAIGDDLVMPAFTSTTLKPGGAGFEGGPDGARFVIRVPAGARGAYVNAAGRYSSIPREKEFLMPPGARFRVVSVKKQPGTYPVVTLEHVL